MPKLVKKLSDIKPDIANANRSSPEGQELIESSYQRYGAGRSWLIDADGNIIAGNQAYAAAGSTGTIGEDDIIVVQTDGTKQVVVQRTDVRLYKDKAARELSIIDNQSNKHSYRVDVDQVMAHWSSGIDLSRCGFNNEEIRQMMDVKNDASSGDIKPKKFKVSVKCKDREQMDNLIHRLKGEGYDVTGTMS